MLEPSPRPRIRTWVFLGFTVAAFAGLAMFLGPSLHALVPTPFILKDSLEFWGLVFPVAGIAIGRAFAVVLAQRCGEGFLSRLPGPSWAPSLLEVGPPRWGGTRVVLGWWLGRPPLSFVEPHALHQIPSKENA